MINIIAKDQELIDYKDRRILSLENLMKEKDECKDTSKTIDLLEKANSEKEFQLDKIKKDMEKMCLEIESDKSKLIMENEQGVYIQETMKSKIEELMKIIGDKNIQITELKKGNEIPEAP